MKEETTSRLVGILENINNKNDGKKFIKEHSKKNLETFAVFFNKCLNEKKLVLADVVKKSGISTNYVYQIINGKKNPSRDKLIALCIAASMSFKETNRGLVLGGYAPLYPKNKRDIHIGICINTGMKSVLEVNICLEENGEEPLKV